MRILIAVLASLLVAGLPVSAASAQIVCRPADQTSAHLINELGHFSSATTGDNKVVRDTLRLPLVPAANLTLVTSETVCKKARTTYQSTLGGLGGTPFSGRVHVVQIGTVYAVLDPALRFGDPNHWAVQIQDSHFKKLSGYCARYDSLHGKLRCHETAAQLDPTWISARPVRFHCRVCRDRVFAGPARSQKHSGGPGSTSSTSSAQAAP